MKDKEKKNEYSNIYVADFETYVQEKNIVTPQEKTYVWCATYLNMQPEKKPVITSGIDEMLMSLTSNHKAKEEITVYFHNLKFDGSFIINWLLNKGYKFIKYNQEGKDGHKYLNRSKLRRDQYNCVISEMNQYYSISFNYYGKIIYIIDSLKLIPLSIAEVGKAYGTPHRKTEMEYTGVKSVNMLTPEDRTYIENDVYVLKEAMYYMLENGYDGLTIGSCCMSEFMSMYSAENWDFYFPNLENVLIKELGISQYEYVVKSYHGGWCYCNKAIAGKKLHNGKVFDANSHYPSQMALKSYPINIGKYYKAENNRFEDVCQRRMNKDEYYYFIRFSCSFKLKEKHFPFIQIKGDPSYRATEMLESSEIIEDNKKIKSHTITIAGKPVYKRSNIVEMTMTKSDWELFCKSYDITDLTIYDCLLFGTESGEVLFGAYIHKYMKEKIEAGKAKNPGKKFCAKLKLNNLYGKFATNPDSTYKIPELVNNILHFTKVNERAKKAGYIAIGSAITSYCRCITIGLANENYKHFAYADTDSVHLYDVPRNYAIKGVKIDPFELGAWDNETDWDTGKFLRAKTYIEHVTHEHGKKVETPYWNVKCAGMTKMGREEALKDIEKLGPEVFKAGYEVRNLKPNQINGGVLLTEYKFKIEGD